MPRTRPPYPEEFKPGGRRTGRQLDRAIELAQMVAQKSAAGREDHAGLGPSRAHRGRAAAFERLESDMAELFETHDGREGLRSFVERREARFVGR